MKFINIVLAFLITIPCGIIMSGCGATDWATREIPDGSSLDQGDQITVIRKDGAAVTGTFKGLTSLSPSEYADAYARSAAETFEGKLLPKIGQRIRFLTTISDTKVWEGEFLGFDRGSLWMRPKNTSDPEKIYFTSLRCLSARNDKVFHRAHLRNMFMQGDIPLISALEIEDAAGSHKVSISSIERIILGGLGLDISLNDFFRVFGDQ